MSLLGVIRATPAPSAFTHTDIKITGGSNPSDKGQATLAPSAEHATCFFSTRRVSALPEEGVIMP